MTGLKMKLVTKIYGDQAKALIDEIVGQEKVFEFKVATEKSQDVVEVWVETHS